MDTDLLQVPFIEAALVMIVAVATKISRITILELVVKAGL